nr:benzoate 4-monooxygenase cytochrome p450 [Colletotrichum truncatum]KAF6799360.1 benzoate 4-monooxygenase cytochrome p450 [Colletotrichum truncatum]
MGSNQPRWPAPSATAFGSVYPDLDLITESPNPLSWPVSNTTNPSLISHEDNAAWIDDDLSKDDPARELNNLQWPLPGPVTRPSDSINWSEIAKEQNRREQRSLPRRRSRYRYIQSENRAVPIPTPASASSQEGQQESDPLQRWKDSPPQDEPACMEAIHDALRTTLVNPEGGNTRSTPRYSQANSGTSFDSGDSGSSIHSASSVWSAGSESSAGQRAGFGPLSRTRQGRIGKKRAASAASAKDSRPFKCTFCCDSFKTKFDWARHEKSRHLNLESWLCTPQGGSVISTVTGRLHCAYCSYMDPSDDHLEEHNHSACHDRPIEARSFGRKDHLVQHLRVMHKLEKLPQFNSWKVLATEVESRCGFCDLQLSTWNKRIDHLAAHFRKGLTMKDWKGEHGFSPTVAGKVIHALPPYLIGSESLSVVPFSATKQGTRDHFAQISSRTHGFKEDQTADSTQIERPVSIASSSILSSRAATSKAFTEILERHLKHFAEEHISQGIFPTDEMLRQESRRVIYDSDHEWNQTVADNSEWLAQFRKRNGLDNHKGGQDDNMQES